MNISYELNFSMKRFHDDINIQQLVGICLDNYHTTIFDDIVGVMNLPKEAAFDFLDELENRYMGTPKFQLFSTYKSIFLNLFVNPQIKNLKGAFLEVLAFKILKKYYRPHTTSTDCIICINGWRSNLTVDIAMEYDSSALCCECKVPTSKFDWNIFKNLLDIKMQSQNFFDVYAITLDLKERMDSKKQRIENSVEESRGIIDDVYCIAREDLANFNI